MPSEDDLTSILAELPEAAEGEELTVGEVLHRFDDRGFGPILLPPALIALMPTGAIPTVPSVCGLMIVFVAGQLLIGREKPYLPESLASMAIDRERVERAVEAARPWTKRIDDFVSESRWAFMSRQTSRRAVAGACVALGLAMVPLELVPFAAGAPAFVVALLALGLSSRDGVVTISGFVVLGLSAAVGLWLW